MSTWIYLLQTFMWTAYASVCEVERDFEEPLWQLFGTSAIAALRLGRLSICWPLISESFGFERDSIIGMITSWHFVA